MLVRIVGYVFGSASLRSAFDDRPDDVDPILILCCVAAMVSDSYVLADAHDLVAVRYERVRAGRT